MATIKEYVIDRRILVLVALVVVLALLDFHYGLHFGIEFVGGTQIPITLEHSINATAMSSLISALDQRVSTFGLKQVTVEGIGNSEVYVTIPTVSASDVNQTIGIIESQGRFDGIVNGKEALNGSGILRGSIGVLPPQQSNNSVGWGVTFFVTQDAANNFAKIVFGQGNKPLYMFLDRPQSAVVVMSESAVINGSASTEEPQEIAALQEALSFGNQTIPVIVVSNTSSSIENAEKALSSESSKYSTILVQSNLNASLIQYIKNVSYASSGNTTVKLVDQANMTPQYTSTTYQLVVDSWSAVGLLSAPILNPSITNGNVSDSYQVTGASPSTLSNTEKLAFAQTEGKTIASVLTGGALPVAVIPGTPETIPPTLGKHFLYISAIAVLIAVLFVSAFIVIRYRKIFLVAPILATTLVELFVIVSIIGLIGTIDLAAIAGMIAVIGTGVDAQIIITDEILAKKEGSSAKALMSNAFYIVWADAAILIIAMLPLFFSTSLVSVISFSESTIIGALLAVLVTRPAYGAIISKKYT